MYVNCWLAELNIQANWLFKRISRNKIRVLVSCTTELPYYLLANYITQLGEHECLNNSKILPMPLIAAACFIFLPDGRNKTVEYYMLQLPTNE